MRHARLLPVALAFALVAGCGAGGDSGEAAPDPRGKTFLSTDVTGHDLVGGTRITLQIGAGGGISVQAGCNTLGGTASLDGGVLSVSDLGTTEMGCSPDRHAQDQWIAEFLTASPEYVYEGDTLTLRDDATSIVLVDREVADPDRPLEGTRWVVDTVVTGDTASNTAGMENAYLVFEDGAVSGFTGCNSFGGPATVDGDTITLGAIRVTQMFCEETEGLERHILDVLTGAVRYTIDADRLVLDSTVLDIGLGLRAN